MRVRTEYGWKWQIKDVAVLMNWDWRAETDQETLDNIGMDLSGIEILNNS